MYAARNGQEGAITTLLACGSNVDVTEKVSRCFGRHEGIDISYHLYRYVAGRKDRTRLSDQY
jgi:hypothetical protein